MRLSRKKNIKKINTEEDGEKSLESAMQPESYSTSAFCILKPTSSFW